MIIKKLNDVPITSPSGYEGVKKQVLIGPGDGSEEIVMRYFTLAPGGASPYHTHPWPHLVKIEVGTGVTVDKDGSESPVQAGDYVYVSDDEVHQFKNTGTGEFGFMCIVPRRGEP